MQGRTVVEITSNDPQGIPDGDDDEPRIVLHFDNGGTVSLPVSEKGFSYNNPDEVRWSMSEFRQASQITNAASGLRVIKNAERDYSLKIISGDGSKDVTIIRFAGESAEADIQTVHQLFLKLGEVLGLDW